MFVIISTELTVLTGLPVLSEMFSSSVKQPVLCDCHAIGCFCTWIMLSFTELAGSEQLAHQR